MILIRHGQSSTNTERAFTGQLDALLSDLGREQAARAAAFVAETYHPGRIYSSDLTRAMDTAEPLARLMNLPILPEPRLREILIPEWQGRKFSELVQIYPDMCDLWFHDIGNFRGPDGESMRDVAARVEDCLRELCRTNEGRCIAVITHATPIRAMQTLWTFRDMDAMKDVPWCNNASATVAEYSDDRFTLLFANQSEHLGDMRTTMPVKA